MPLFSRLILLLMLSAAPAIAQNEERITTTYERDDSLFHNPERGFFISIQPTGGGRVGQQETPHPPLLP